MTHHRFLPTVFALLGMLLAAGRPVRAEDAPFNEVARDNFATFSHLGRIVGLNLLNRLYLSEDQLTTWIRVLERRQRLGQRLKDEISAHHEAAMREFDRLYRVVESDQDPPHELIEQVKQAEEHTVLAMMRAQVEARELGRELNQSLEPNQVDLVAAYSPCLVPQKDRLQPGRIGSVAVGDDVMQGAEKIRALNGVVFWALKEKIVSDVTAKLGHRIPQAREETLRRQVRTFFEAVRATDDFDWTTRKHQIVADHLERILQVAGASKEAGRVEEKILQHLLDPHFLPILRRRLQRTREHPPSHRARLADTLSACEDGGCGEPDQDSD